MLELGLSVLIYSASLDGVIPIFALYSNQNEVKRNENTISLVDASPLNNLKLESELYAKSQK